MVKRLSSTDQNSLPLTNVPTPVNPGDAASKSYVDSHTSSAPDATTSSKGIVQLAGDLAGTAAAPTVPALATKEPAVAAGTTAQYYRGDKTFQTLTQDVVPDGTTNKAYTITDKNKLAAITGTNTGDETTATIKSKLSITTLSGSNTGDQTSVTGNAGTATTLQTARTIQTNLASTTATSFDGSANITPGITGNLPISHGGTGAATLPTGILKGAGTGAITAAVAGTDYIATTTVAKLSQGTTAPSTPAVGDIWVDTN